eukprot:COSAG04_NODE_615_length_11914_cov_12.688447_10_plen_512_part_00
MDIAGGDGHPFGVNESRPATGTSPQARSRDVGSAKPAAVVTYKQIDIKAGLKAGTLTSDDAIALMEEQMEHMRAEMQEQMDTKIDATLSLLLRPGFAVSEGGTTLTLARAVRGVVAKFTEAPTNFHQATVFFLAAVAPEDEAMARRAPLLYAVSLAMVGLQSATAVGVFVGTMTPSCATSDQCGALGPGRFCMDVDRCRYCGAEVPLPLDTEGVCTFEGEFTAADAACTTRNNAYDPNHVGFNLTRVAEVCTMPYTGRVGVDGAGLHLDFKNTTVASWCQGCVRNDGTVESMTGDTLIDANVAAMGRMDEVALVFATFIVAFTVVGELKDIEICSMAVAHAGDRLSKGWRLALGFLLWMRRWLFLPGLVMNVPALVLYKGGDALSVCLNTVAILFLCDIDNICFALALGERVRARVEDAGRVELDDHEATALARTKAVHVVLIVLGVLGGVWSGIGGLMTNFIPPVALVLGGLAEAFVPRVGTLETAKRVGEVLGACVLGGSCVSLLVVNI